MRNSLNLVTMSQTARALRLAIRAQHGPPTPTATILTTSLTSAPWDILLLSHECMPHPRCVCFSNLHMAEHPNMCRYRPPHSRATPPQTHVSLHATALRCAGRQDSHKKGSNDSASRPPRGSSRARRVLNTASDDLRRNLERERRRRLKLEARVISLENLSGRLLAEQTDAQRASWCDADRAILGTPPRGSESSDSGSRSDAGVPATPVSRDDSPPSQELRDALCQHHGYLLGGDGLPYPISDDAIKRETLWAQSTQSGRPSSVATPARPRTAGTTRTNGILRRVPAMFVVAAASPTAVDALTMHLEPHDTGHFAIGAILAAIFLMWTLMGCGSGRPWTVTLTAPTMSSLTITALLAVVAIVEAGFMTEEMDPDSRSYHEAIATLVIGSCWVAHLALSIYRSTRGSTLRRILSRSESSPRPLGPRPRSKHLGARQMMRGRLVGRSGRARLRRHGLRTPDVLARSIAPSSPRTCTQCDSCPAQFFPCTPTPFSLASCCCKEQPRCPARTKLSSSHCYGFSCLYRSLPRQ